MDVPLADGDVLRFGGQPGQNYLEFVYTVVAPDAAQPDREAAPLTPAPAVKPKPPKAKRTGAARKRR